MDFKDETMEDLHRRWNVEYFILEREVIYAPTNEGLVIAHPTWEESCREPEWDVFI